jgi:hypothetical protein
MCTAKISASSLTLVNDPLDDLKDIVAMPEDEESF